MTLFELSNLVVLPFWLLMVVAPGWSVTRRVVGSPWVVAPAALIYVVGILPGLASILPEIVNPRQARIAGLFGTPTGVTVAWAHIVAIDLFVGRWMYCDSRSRRYSPFWVSPLLALTLLLCPIGLAIYLLARALIGGAAVHE